MSGNEALQHLFIGGCPRSGTTLLASLLSRRERMFAVPESQFKTDLVLASAGKDWQLAQAAEFVRQHWRFRMWKVTLAGSYAGTCDLAGVRRVVDDCYSVFRDANFPPDRSCVVDHTPDNVVWGKTLCELFPEAAFIHLVRDPRAVVASVLPLDWGPNTARQAALWWARHVFYGLALESYAPERVLRVRYEDLVANPDAVIKRIAEHRGAPGGLREEASAGLSLPDYTVKQHALVGGPVQTENAEKWRRLLGTEQIMTIERELRDSLAMLGYEPLLAPQRKRNAAHVRDVLDYLYDSAASAKNYLKITVRRRRHGQRP